MLWVNYKKVIIKNIVQNPVSNDTDFKLSATFFFIQIQVQYCNEILVIY